LFLDVVDDGAAWPATAPAVVPRVLDDLRTSLQQAVGHARGAPVMVLVLPTCWHCSDAAWAARLTELQFDPAQFRRGLAQQRVVAVCAELGLPCLDATPWLEAAGDPRAQFVSDRGHLSVAGHERVAEGLSAAVQGALK
jgi:lysophospholipase L1-like esterase